MGQRRAKQSTDPMRFLKGRLKQLEQEFEAYNHENSNFRRHVTEKIALYDHTLRKLRREAVYLSDSISCIFSLLSDAMGFPRSLIEEKFVFYMQQYSIFGENGMPKGKVNAIKYNF